MPRVGIDTGGTFTDFVVERGGRIEVHKVLSTPDDPARAVLAGLRDLFPDRSRPARITYGTTVATNALLERRGARVCLVTTRGFEDVLEIGRQARPDLYALEPRRPQPLVPRADRIGVPERVTFDGRVLVPLTAAALRVSSGGVAAAGRRPIAVAFLHSYAQPRHERAVGRALATLRLPVTLSHELVREYREYERTSTAVVNAYVAPVMSRHLGRLAARTGRGRLRVMQSNGGAVAPSLARREPVRTMLSGPAGGVVGAARLAAAPACGASSRSTWAARRPTSRCVDGAIPQRSEWTIDGLRGAGAGDRHPHRRRGRRLDRAPRSRRRARGRTGERRRRSRAGLLRARDGADRHRRQPGARPARPGGLSRRPHAARSRRVPRRAVDTLARRLGLSRTATAEGIVRVANAAMERALRVISVERGHDPRDLHPGRVRRRRRPARLRARA